MEPSCPLRAVDIFDYVVLTPERAEDAAAIIAESFADEPTVLHPPPGMFVDPDRSSRLKQLQTYISFIKDSCASNGLSVACIDRTNGSMAGAVYLRDFKEPVPEIPFSELPIVWAPVSLVLEAEAEYELKRPGLRLGECVDVLMLGVHPDYRRRNIAQLLTDTAVMHAHHSGFKYVILESSGSYSAKCAERAGMKVSIRKEYALTDGVLKGMPLEHPALILWEVECQSEPSAIGR